MQLFISLFLCLLFSSNTVACSCVKRSLSEQVERAHYIALVEIEQSELTSFIQDNVPHQKVRFKSIEQLKGAEEKSHFYMHNPSPGFCGGAVSKGQKLVVFLVGNDYTSICSGSFLYKETSKQKYDELIRVLNGKN
ncbi:MAG: hypothetical protein JXR18_01895 [Neptuniibacter sp.]